MKRQNLIQKIGIAIILIGTLAFSGCGKLAELLGGNTDYTAQLEEMAQKIEKAGYGSSRAVSTASATNFNNQELKTKTISQPFWNVKFVNEQNYSSNDGWKFSYMIFSNEEKEKYPSGISAIRYFDENDNVMKNGITNFKYKEFAEEFYYPEARVTPNGAISFSKGKSWIEKEELNGKTVTVSISEGTMQQWDYKTEEEILNFTLVRNKRYQDSEMTLKVHAELKHKDCIGIIDVETLVWKGKNIRHEANVYVKSSMKKIGHIVFQPNGKYEIIKE